MGSHSRATDLATSWSRAIRFQAISPPHPPDARGSSPLIPFVARINATGTELVYATLFGSRNGNVAYAFDLALDAASAPIVVGETNGADFPTTPGAYQPTFNEPSATINRGWDGFVTRFNASGSAMVFSTYLGAAPIFDPNHAGSSARGRRECPRGGRGRHRLGDRVRLHDVRELSHDSGRLRSNALGAHRERDGQRSARNGSFENGRLYRTPQPERDAADVLDLSRRAVRRCRQRHGDRFARRADGGGHGSAD